MSARYAASATKRPRDTEVPIAYPADIPGRSYADFRSSHPVRRISGRNLGGCVAAVVDRNAEILNRSLISVHATRVPNAARNHSGHFTCLPYEFRAA